MGGGLAELHRYPEGGSSRLRAAVARKYDVEQASVIVGGGSDELIEILAKAGKAADAAPLRSLKDTRKARGWWKEEDEPKDRKKAEPTLTMLAADAAIELEKRR